MTELEQKLYLKTTKSVVGTFEKFVDSLVMHDDVLSDAELLASMKRIQKQLTTVITTWDSKLGKLNMINGIGTDILQALRSDPNYEEFKDLVESRQSNSSNCSIDSTNNAATPSGSGVNVRNPTRLSQNASLMMKFGDVEEELILGPDGFLIEETTTGFWKCIPCGAVNIPVFNMISHINGKNHKRKCGVRKN